MKNETKTGVIVGCIIGTLIFIVQITFDLNFDFLLL